MFEGAMRIAQVLTSGLNAYKETPITSEDLEEAEQRLMDFIAEVDSQYPLTFSWRLRRVPDERLRRLGKELDEGIGLSVALLDAAFAFELLTESPEKWHDSARDIQERFARVLPAIDNRLDELNW
jgi:hypothetical protein